jgi:hypothetical protein
MYQPTIRVNHYQHECIVGTAQGVAVASAQVESYFRSVISQVCSVKMILTAAHREKLTSADLSR